MQRSTYICFGKIKQLKLGFASVSGTKEGKILGSTKNNKKCFMILLYIIA